MTFSADIRAGKKNSTKMSICYTNGRWFLHTFNFTVDIDIQVKREWRKPLVKWNTFNTFRFFPAKNEIIFDQRSLEFNNLIMTLTFENVYIAN